MTKFIATNSVTRRYLKRGELMAKRRAEASQNASQEVKHDMSRVLRATSLGSLRDRQDDVTEIKPQRTWHKDSNPFGNKIHAVQKSRGKSTPLI